MKKQSFIFIKSFKREASHESSWHQHQSGQLFIIKQGLLVLETKSGRSLMPCSCAGWLPPQTHHKAKGLGPTVGESFYLAPSLCLHLPKQPCVFSPNALLGAILSRMISWRKSEWSIENEHLLKVMIDELKKLTPSPLYLPIPAEKTLEKLTHAFILHPEFSITLEEGAKSVHLSKRTFTRHFRQQTGMPFTKWCQQARIMKSVEYLAKGKSVTWISLTLGYNSVSAFIKVFHQFLGSTPSSYAKKINFK